MNPTRRSWLSTCFVMAAWPEVLAAHKHARAAAASQAGHFENFDAGTAADIEAVTAQIIPSTDGPGAREAGVIHFIDRALSTFARDERDTYRLGMSQLQHKRQELFPESANIASLSDEQQTALVRSIETSSFFELLRTHAVLGFLADPSYGGNRGEIGWRQIGFDDRMAWEHPFGYYDSEVNPETVIREHSLGGQR